MKKVSIQGKKLPSTGIPKAFAPERIEIGDALDFECLDKEFKEGLEVSVREIEKQIEVFNKDLNKRKY